MKEELLPSDIIYNESKNTIKIWPYLDDISQAILPYTFKYLSNNPQMVINLDFYNVNRFNSSIAAIVLKKLVSLAIQDNTKRVFKIIMPESKSVANFMQSSGFLKILDSYFCFDNYNGDLFDAKITIQDDTFLTFDEIWGIKKTSFPIFHLKYNEHNERESVNMFSEWLDDAVLPVLDKYNVKTSLLFIVMTELAKNSLDHTNNDAFFGIDIIENEKNGVGEFMFSCSDLGVGIAQTVRKYLHDNPQKYLRSDIWKHGSLTDMYKWAFTVGNSTSKKCTNKGIGMTMIIDGVNNLNMDLSYFDANSMMQIPKSVKNELKQNEQNKNPLSHAMLRRKAWNTENKVGFYYFGRLKF